MLYFVPAWYQQNEWSENEQYWYARRARSEFDDTVKHIQLFHRSGAYPFQVMLLSFAPNYRHFLHRQGVFHAPYWSVFDAMQEIERKKVVTFSFHNLNWPEHIEFIYSPFSLVAQLHGERYAQVEFGEDGNLIQVDMYQNGQISRRNIYDDRGFISSTILFEEARPIYQDYLTDKGVWKLRQFFDDGHVVINQKLPTYILQYQGQSMKKQFSRTSYESMEQIIQEVLDSYISLLEETSIFCIAMHERHTGMLRKVLEGKKVILSFFQDRYDLGQHPNGVKMVNQANYMITDSIENQTYIEHIMDRKLDNITDITPFDSRVDFGISQQLNVQKILLPVDGLTDDMFIQSIVALAQYMVNNENARVHLFTRYSDFARKRDLLAKTREILVGAGFEEGWAAEQTNLRVENMLDEDIVPIKFFAEQCVDELSVTKCLREQRLIVDMRPETDLYLQIASISMGIPQIVAKASQFVEHDRNGWIIENAEALPAVLAYYLENLTYWNEAMVAAYEIGKRYTTSVLIEKWKEVIDIVGSDSSITDREA